MFHQNTWSIKTDEEPTKYQQSPCQLRPAALRAGAAASPFTVERLDGHAHVPGDNQIGAGEDEFLLIDGGSALSNPYLPVLLGQSDAILLVTHLGQTSRQDLDRTLTLLQPWQDRMIGNVALAA